MKLSEELPQTVVLRVSAADIRAAQGCRGNPFKCPLAVCANRTFGVSECLVGNTYVDVADAYGFTLARYILSVEAKRFIALFDRDQEVEPDRFTLVRVG